MQLEVLEEALPIARQPNLAPAIALVATLAGRLGIEALARRLVRLRRDRPARRALAARRA
jgi:hypothetical protein